MQSTLFRHLFYQHRFGPLMIRLIVPLLAMLFIVTTPTLHASEPAEITHHSELWTGPKVTDISEIDFSSEHWQAYEDTHMQLGFADHILWIKQVFVNTSPTPLAVVSEITMPLLQGGRLFLVDDDTVKALTLMPNSSPAYAVKLGSHESKTFIWRLEHTGDLKFHLHVDSSESFVIHQQVQHFFKGLSYAISIIALTLGILIFFISRERIYIYLALFSACCLFFAMQLEGDFRYFNNEVLPQQKLQLFLLGLFAFEFSFGLFTRGFLKLKVFSQIAQQSLSFFTALACLSTLIAAAVPSSLFLQQVSFLFTFLFLTATTFIGLIVFKQGFKNGLSITLMSLVLMVGIGSLFSFIDIYPNANNILGTSANAFAIAQFLGLAGAIAYFYRAQNEQKTGLKELIKLGDARYKDTIQRHDIQLQETTKQLQLSNNSADESAKTRILSAVSHEVRTPISGILGIVEIMRDTDLSSAQSKYLDTIQSTTTHLLDIIKEFLDYSKIESGHFEQEYVTFDLRELFSSCENIFAIKTKEYSLSLSIDVHESLPSYVRGDRDKIRLVLNNLISILISFKPSGSLQIKVSPGKRDTSNSKEIAISLCHNDLELSKAQVKLLQSPTDSQADDSMQEAAILYASLATKLLENIDSCYKINTSAPATLSFNIRLLTSFGESEIDSYDQLKDLSIISLGLTTQSSEMLRNALQGLDINLRILPESGDASTAIDFADIIFTSTAQLETIAHNHNAQYILLGSDSVNADAIKSHPNIHITTISPSIEHKELIQHLINLDFNTQPKLDRIAGLTVLLVEDNAVNQLVMKGMLSKLRIDCIIAENGAIALERTKDQLYDVILMDCDMPVMNGYDATTEIRQRERESGSKQTLIIALSAHTDPEHKQKALSHGMDYFLAKPISQSDLTKALMRRFID